VQAVRMFLEGAVACGRPRPGIVGRACVRISAELDPPGLTTDDMPDERDDVHALIIYTTIRFCDVLNSAQIMT
jgi:hypothetical protein